MPTEKTTAFDAVLCDLDDVIRFFDHSELARREAALGLPAGRTMAAAFAPPHGRALVLGQLTKEEWTAAMVNELPKELTPSQAMALAGAFIEAPSHADRTVVDLLRRARTRYRLLLVTNATPWLDQDLARIGLADLADEVVNSSAVGAAKPDPLIYRIAADRAGVPAERCLFVDDRLSNVEAARDLGMSGLHYRGPAELSTLLT
ncbi:HAD family hydrolase [Kitasatospora azatica]|uniref:HAD family hydrolase n=1 Tax=Kitasatospora azatica TaxID=58347 RepID=UPI00055F6F24|nr:HAD-IA family hydrolase [Kitasatospora azatica]